MGCCSSSNKIDQTLLNKIEKEELKGKSSNQIASNNELKIIDFELQTIFDFLLSKMPSPKTVLMTYLIYFLDCFYEKISLINQKKGTPDIDLQAVKIVRVSLQKLHGMLENENEVHLTEDDSPIGAKINKLLQDLELNVKVIINSNLPLHLTKEILKLTSNTLFSFYLAGSFWPKKTIYMKWCDFHTKFSSFAKLYYQIEIDEISRNSLRELLDKNEEQRVHNQDWETFLKEKWVFWKKRKEFLGKTKKDLAAKNLVKTTNGKSFFSLTYDNNLEKYKSDLLITIGIFEQNLPKLNKITQKNLFEESIAFGGEQCDVVINANQDEKEQEKCIVFFKKTDQKCYLSNLDRVHPCKFLLSEEKVLLSNDMIIEIRKQTRLRIEKITEEKCILNFLDENYNVTGSIEFTEENFNDEFKKFGVSNVTLSKNNGNWTLSQSLQNGCDLSNSIYIIFGSFSEFADKNASDSFLITQPYELKKGMVMKIGDNYYIFEGIVIKNKII